MEAQTEFKKPKVDKKPSDIEIRVRNNPIKERELIHKKLLEGPVDKNQYLTHLYHLVNEA